MRSTVSDHAPVFNQLNLVVRDLEATLAFYRMLGLAVEAAPGGHASVKLPNGVAVEFDTTEFVGLWDSGWTGATGGSTVLGFGVGSRAAVDELYGELTAAGHRGRQAPYDAFWGARYAIVEDPDGNPVGIMSPVDETRKTWPSEPPPRNG
jgi:catechol 2,3-dioxygenase-like lactoylglutathione lyase family enzyme